VERTKRRWLLGPTGSESVHPVNTGVIRAEEWHAVPIAKHASGTEMNWRSMGVWRLTVSA
jgi:hypothetical protein